MQRSQLFFHLFNRFTELQAEAYPNFTPAWILFKTHKGWSSAKRFTNQLMQGAFIIQRMDDLSSVVAGINSTDGSTHNPSKRFDPRFVTWFRSVAPYIHKFRNQTFVVGVTGEAIAAGKLDAIAHDLALIQSMGAKVVLAYGFRPQVNEQLNAKGHQAQYANGIRITDSIGLDCAQEAAGQLRYEIEAAFSQGLPNTPMAGSKVRVISGNFVTAKPIGIINGIDYQHSGLVRKVDVEGIHKTLDLGALVLISPLGFSPTGEAFNLSMEEVATSVAIALGADKLIFVTEVPGIHTDFQDQDSPLETELPLARAKAILKQLPAPMQPGCAAFYLQHCILACEAGLERSHIISFAIDGALLLEIYVHDGIGTMVVNEKLEYLREAGHEDITSILQLIEPYEKDGSLAQRGRTEIERDINFYSVIEHDGIIFGCAALYPYPEEKTGEMAALTVVTSAQGAGDGARLLRRIEQRAKVLGLCSIFVLTTRTMHWFIKRGFQPKPPDWLPASRQQLYSQDRRSQILVKYF